jgi:hypothetical protein
MKKFVLRTLLFLSPFLAALLLELFVFPIDAFTFRAWEALSVHTLTRQFPGPFYPNHTLEKREEGDLGHGTRFAKARRVRWVTDAHGFRFDPSLGDNIDGVIIGDSFVVGSGLDQMETLSEALGRKRGGRFYPYTADKKEFLNDPRFTTPFPPVVVLALSEIYISGEDALGAQPVIASPASKRGALPLPAAELIDRASKMNMLRWLQACVKRALNRAATEWLLRKPYANENAKVGADGAMLFHRMELLPAEISVERVNAFLGDVAAFSAAVRERGGVFVFMPIPKKSTVYYALAGVAPTDFISRIAAVLNQGGVPTVDLLKPYMAAQTKIYQDDDTHWNKDGVELAAEELNKKINEVLKK